MASNPVPILEIDSLTTVPLGQGVLKTKGVLMCVAVCVNGLIQDNPSIAMTHIVADPNEFDEAVNLFNDISQIYIIGGTDDWYGSALFQQIKTKALLKFDITKVTSQFNPSNTQEVEGDCFGVDIIFDGEPPIVSYACSPDSYNYPFSP